MLYTIAKRYGVPARMGGKVLFTDVTGKKFVGIIKKAIGASLGVEFLGQPGIKPLHPSWNIEYL